MNSIIRSQIIISDDLAQAKEDVLKDLDSQNVKIFEKEDSFLIEDSKSVVKEAYISETSSKYILLISPTYNTFAQNSLLKILEEPPSNIIFILMTQSLSGLLPTICSRLGVKKMNFGKVETKLDLDIKNMNLKDIFDFLKNHERESMINIKSFIKTISMEAMRLYSFDEKELSLFDDSYRLANLHGNTFNVLSPILLMIYEKKTFSFKR